MYAQDKKTVQELETILLAHAARYPMMQPQDAVKLVYQNEFGGGHLIRDPRQAYERLLDELQGVAPVPRLPLLEPIGNGVARVQLAALAVNGVAPKALFGWFLASAEQLRGEQPRFLRKLDTLQTLAAQGAFAFDSAALGKYLDGYAAEHFPPVSHSAQYRALYAPAYRVVLESLVPRAAK